MVSDDKRVQTDEQLVAAIAAGDHGAFGELYDRYSRLVYSVAMAMLRDPEAAEDATQDIFLKLWGSATAYRPEMAAVKTWLTTIAHRHTLDQLRRRRVRTAAGVTPSYGRPADELAAEMGGDRDTELEAIREVQGEELRKVFADLPENERRSLELAYFNGYTQREIAELLDIPLGTVKTRMFSGVKRLRTMIDERGGVLQ